MTSSFIDQEISRILVYVLEAEKITRKRNRSKKPMRDF